MTALAASARIDLTAAARQLDVDLAMATAQLAALYQQVDARIAATTAGLDLPCGAGCAACCHDSVVLLTPLEFFFAWQWAQQHLDDGQRAAMVERGRSTYRGQQTAIDSLSDPGADVARRQRVALALHFSCPLLGSDGLCQIYPARSLQSRLFGQSFNDQSGVYGCRIVGHHLADRVVTLVSARAVFDELRRMPLTYLQQVYPYYLALFYGDG